MTRRPTVAASRAKPGDVPSTSAAPPLRIAFAGTPEFAATALSHLLAKGFEVALVFSQPDRPSGRGQQVQESPVKRVALAHGLTVIQPPGLKLDGRFAGEAQAAHAALVAADVQAMVIVAYGQMLPAWMLQAPPLGCFNIHGSLLPRWRGAAPIQRAIEAGDTQTGITIIHMDAGLDTGAMLATEATPIGPDDTAGTLHDRLAPMGARLMAKVLLQAVKGKLRPVAQPDKQVYAYATKIHKLESVIHWQQPAAMIERRVRAFDPFPGCTFELDGEVTKLWRAKVVPQTSRADAAPGTIVAHDGVLEVACGEDALQLLEIQRPGGRRMTAAQYLHGADAARARQPAESDATTKSS